MKMLLQFFLLLGCVYVSMWMLCIVLTSGKSMTGQPGKEMATLALTLALLLLLKRWLNRQIIRQNDKKMTRNYWQYFCLCIGVGLASNGLMPVFGWNTMIGIGNLLTLAAALCVVLGSLQMKKRKDR